MFTGVCSFGSNDSRKALGTLQLNYYFTRLRFIFSVDLFRESGQLFHRHPTTKGLLKGAILGRACDELISRRQQVIVPSADTPGKDFLAENDRERGQSVGGARARQIPNKR
jgi:hypothetical protein